MEKNSDDHQGKPSGQLLFFPGVKRNRQNLTRETTDFHMLESLATAFEMRGQGFEFMPSFNDDDIADLLRRASGRIAENSTK